MSATGTSAVAQGADEPVVATGPVSELHGSMMGHVAGEDHPVLLIIPGSGPTDRDGNSPLGITAGTYRLLASDLAARGITTIRIDKRGMFESAADNVDPNAITIEDYADDVRAWVSAAMQATGASCVWLAGHSEGGLVALATVQDAQNVCGVLLIAAPGRRLSDVMREQLRANPANAFLLDDAMAVIDALEAGSTADVGEMHPALQQLFHPAVQDFLISIYSYDPAVLMAGYDGPVLVVQGDADLQVTVEDAEALASGRDDVSPVILPGVNHVLKEAPADDRDANLATYSEPNLPLAPGVVSTIAAFVTPE